MKRWAHFDYEESDGVATLTFSRPERLNALTFEVYADIRDLTDSLRSRGDEVRVLVIRGRGRGFCSGGDVDEIIARGHEPKAYATYNLSETMPPKEEESQ